MDAFFHLADISAHAQTRHDNPASSLDLGARGALAKQTSVAAPSDRQESSVEFSARAGFATDYIYRGDNALRSPLTNQRSELFSKLRSIISTLAPA
jgi:hypothetical protein